MTKCFSPSGPSSGHTGFLHLKHEAVYTVEAYSLKPRHLFLQLIAKFITRTPEEYFVPSRPMTYEDFVSLCVAFLSFLRFKTS